MKKRIICFVLAFLNLFSFAVYARNDEKEVYQEEFARLAAYNIMSALDSESMNKEITQLQFREALSSIAGDNQKLMERIDSFGEVYDVNGKVSLIKALISLVKLVGYSDEAIQKGGTYNSGYMGIASNCGILKGMSGLKENDNITYAQAGKLIYNALEVPLYEYDFKGGNIYYQANEDKTILTEYLSIYEVRGVVNATFDYAITGYSKTNKNEITIGDSNYFVNSNKFNSFFGMNVIGYYKYDEENDESKILRLVERKENSSLLLNAPDIKEYKDGKYTYRTEEMTRNKTVSVYSGVQWYYNYEPVTSKVQMDNMNYVPAVGSVQFIDSDNDSKYDIVIVLDYDVRIVDYVRENTIITKNNAGKVMVDSNTVIRDASGNTIDSELTLSEYNVLHTVFADDGVTAKYIIVTSNSVDGRVVSVSTSTNEINLSDGNEYVFTNSMAEYINEIKSKMNVTLFLDINGNVAGYKKGVIGDLLYGYLIELKTFNSDETGEPVVRVKLYDLNEKKIKAFHTAVKFKVDEETYNEKRYEELVSAFCDSDGVLYDQIIRYKVNSDNLIVEIDTAYDGDTNFNPYGVWGMFPARKNGLVKVAGAQLFKETGQSMNSIPENERDRARLTYWVNRYAIERRYIKTSPENPANDWSMNTVVSNDALVLYVPKNRNSQDEYYITTRSAWNMNGEVVLDTYRLENETYLPSLIVAYAGNGAAEFGEVQSTVNNTDLIDVKATPALLTKISYVWNEKAESAAYQIDMLHMGEEKTYFTSNEEWVSSLAYPVKNKQSGADLGVVYGLHEGDIVRFAENGNIITAIEMFVPVSYMKNYTMTNWSQLSRGIMNNGVYIGYAFERFDNAIMALKTPHKADNFSSINFEGTDVFMVAGLDVFEYNLKKKKLEKSTVDCVNYYMGTKNLEQCSIVMVFGDGAEIKNNCIYVINNMF